MNWPFKIQSRYIEDVLDVVNLTPEHHILIPIPEEHEKIAKAVINFYFKDPTKIYEANMLKVLHLTPCFMGEFNCLAITNFHTLWQEWAPNADAIKYKIIYERVK